MNRKELAAYYTTVCKTILLIEFSLISAYDSIEYLLSAIAGSSGEWSILAAADFDWPRMDTPCISGPIRDIPFSHTSVVHVLTFLSPS